MKLEICTNEVGFSTIQQPKSETYTLIRLMDKAGAVLAAVDGFVHSFNYNTGLGDYGPTIILEHKIEDHKFYTLYGHLSLESIDGIEIGTVFLKGQK
jgi:hypothetical protein